jgi:LPS O-antigen subunit length determinant protein (WzzB/FepE family)
MKTYDADNRRLKSGTFLRNLAAVFRRWIDRERELISLRNAVGMMSEARRNDAAEYHDMAMNLRLMREEMREDCQDALRFRWLTADHAEGAVRERIAYICQNIPPRSLAAVRNEIDQAISAQ